MESTFSIIAEPNRRAILSLLAAAERSVGDIERAAATAAALGVQTPARAARGRLRGVARGRTTASLSDQARAAHGDRCLARSVPSLLVGACRRARTSSRSHGVTPPRRKEEKETMSAHRKYISRARPRAPRFRRKGRSGRWFSSAICVIRRQSLGGADRSGASARMGAVRRRPKSRHVRHGQALDGGRADAAGFRNHREARRAADAARVSAGATATCAGSSSRSAKARASRSGTTSIAATSRGAPRAGTSASTSWIGCSPASRSVAWSAPRP